MLIITVADDSKGTLGVVEFRIIDDGGRTFICGMQSKVGKEAV